MVIASEIFWNISHIFSVSRTSRIFSAVTFPIPSTSVKALTDAFIAFETDLKCSSNRFAIVGPT